MTDEERKVKKAERDRRYYEKHKERLREGAREWIKNNKEKKSESSKKWRLDNPDRAKEIARKAAAKRKASGAISEYELANYITQRMLRAAKCRAKERNVPFNLTADDITIPECCPILGIPLYHSAGKATDNSPSLDRVIPSLGYVTGNVRVISNRANRIKFDATLDELQAIVQYLSEAIDGQQDSS